MAADAELGKRQAHHYHNTLEFGGSQRPVVVLVGISPNLVLQEEAWEHHQDMVVLPTDEYQRVVQQYYLAYVSSHFVGPQYLSPFSDVVVIEVPNPALAASVKEYLLPEAAYSHATSLAVIYRLR